MARAALRAGRAPDAVTLLAVTKSVPVDSIKIAIEAGVSHLGENRVQEAEAKYARPLREGEAGYPPTADKLHRAGIVLHMIGTLQRNKVRRAVALFDWVQCVDRLELVDALAGAVQAIRPDHPLPVLIQVNVTGEPTKAGIAPQRLPVLAEAVGKHPQLRGMGLMTIARLGAGETELRRTFATLRGLLEGLRGRYPGDWVHLSMGMTDDYEYAIEEGATIVRIGRAIFGERKA